MTDTPDLPVEYAIEINRRVRNPKAGERGSCNHEPDFLQSSVTMVTLDAEQWRKVQAAIVEALR